jgi:hypothetical protein
LMTESPVTSLASKRESCVRRAFQACNDYYITRAEVVSYTHSLINSNKD